MTTYSERTVTLETTAPPLLSCRELRQTRAAVEVGRVTLVAISVFGVYAAGRGAETRDLLVLALLATSYLIALRLGRLVSPEALGPAVATTLGTLVGFVGTSAMSVLLPPVQLSPERSLAMAAALLCFVGLWECIVHRTTVARRRVLVVGTPVAAGAVARETAKADAPVDVLGLVPEEPLSTETCDVPVVGRLDGLSELVDYLRPDLVVVADGVECESALERLLDVPTDGFRVVGLTSFFENVLGRVPLSNLRGSWFISVLHLRRRAYARWSKRLFDVVAASTALVLASPVMVLVALLLAPSGSILYRQTRLGERGRRFTIVKFRTMKDGAESSGAAWSRADDARVTRLGRILRRAHLDELPQLVNVLRGEMSIVGPRPERPEFVDLLETKVPFWHRRLLVKPGVTGWAQLKGGYASDCEAMADKLSYDLWYLRNRSLLVDIAICAATALHMASGLIPVRRAAAASPRPAATRR
jgi:exopolysaccharide biosynthesis polyprenyl glycosylphosphotransferase